MRREPALGTFSLVTLTLLAGCQAVPSTTPRAPLTDDGLLYVYLRPLSAKLERLSIEIGSASAQATGGEEWPLELQLQRISSRHVGRERLLAVATLPAGSYRGLTVRIAGARLAGTSG
ncbi:MAG TPA: hypothetical protein VD788_13870, partial [Candidatus Polarisedimenticolaceae bacterium]|nr:hypothetical protein [Candidatus Polarisedimenticolaceae bacterium]